MKAKTIVQILVVFILIVYASCKEKEPVDYLSVDFCFILTDSLGNNLFFGENSPYDSSEVKLDTTHSSPKEWSISSYRDTSCFKIDGFYVCWEGAKEEIHVEFFPGDMDTITISNYPNDDGTSSFDYNAVFNSDTICIKCKIDKVYKIIAK